MFNSKGVDLLNFAIKVYDVLITMPDEVRASALGASGMPA